MISTIKGLLNIFIKQDGKPYTNNWTTNTIIAFGIICGILIFSKIFKWLLVKYYDAVLVFMIGLMLGGISKIWPWQENGESILPFNYSGENFILLALIFFILGILFIFGVQLLEKQKHNDEKENHQ